MILKLFILNNIKEANVAGLDGFSSVQSENYFSNNMINNAKENELDERNEIMSEELRQISKNIKLKFITKTHYQI